MSILSRRTRPILLLTAALAGTIGVVAACSDDSTTAITPSPDGGTAAGFDSGISTGSSSSGGTTTSPGSDAGDDGGSVDTDDGGGTPVDDDGGIITDPDGGFDAGAACEVLPDGTYVATTCKTLIRAIRGGTIVAGTYNLEAVTVLSPDCTNAYVPYDHRGTLVVKTPSAGKATFEFLNQYHKIVLSPGPVIIRPTTLRYDVDVTPGLTPGSLDYAATACATTKPPTSAVYSAAKSANNKDQIVLRLPYGTGVAYYDFVKP